MANLLILAFVASFFAAVFGLLFIVFSARRRRTGLKMLAIGVCGFIAFPLAGAVLDIDFEKTDRKPDVTTASLTEPADTPQEVTHPRQRPERIVAAAAQAAEADRLLMTGAHCFGAWDGSHRLLVRMLRDSLREPSSFEHIHTQAMQSKIQGARDVLMTYRARNGFGGMNVEKVRATFEPKTCLVMDISQTG